MAVGGLRIPWLFSDVEILGFSVRWLAVGKAVVAALRSWPLSIGFPHLMARCCSAAAAEAAGLLGLLWLFLVLEISAFFLCLNSWLVVVATLTLALGSTAFPKRIQQSCSAWAA